MHPEHNIRQAVAIFVTATFLLNTMAPTLAHVAIDLQGAQVNANTRYLR